MNTHLCWHVSFSPVSRSNIMAFTSQVNRFIVACTLVFAVTQAMAASQKGTSRGLGYRLVTYKQDTTTLEGRIFQAKGGGIKGMPGVLLFPDWMGISEVSDQYAQQWSRQGYAVFVADIYGQGIRPQGPQEAGKLAGLYKSNRPLMRARAEAALVTLKAQGVDSSRIASIGYCFGGTCALELARAGAHVNGSISVHGNLDTPNSADAKQIKGKILVLHGADDPFVPTEQVANFMSEMRGSGVDWQMMHYGGAVHSFTNPTAPIDSKQGAAFHPVVARRSDQAVRIFLDEVLGAPGKKP
jgi:dienelactone hydrolase